MEKIKIVGARTNNLKNITVEIPKNKITVITGLSGSGKSSLAFDTIFAEGQRRYIESLSSYVRQFFSDIERPDFDYIEGLAPAVAIDQKTSSRNPRSTVATSTEIYDFLRILFSRVGTPHCPNCGVPVESQSSEAITQRILEEFTEKEMIIAKIFAVIVQHKKGEHKFQLKSAKKFDITRVRIDGVEMDISEAINLNLDKHKRHTVELLIGAIQFPVSNEQSKEVVRVDILKTVEKGLKIGNGTLVVTQPSQDEERPKTQFYSRHFACRECGLQFPIIEPQIFSFNNPEGACLKCHGLGVRQVADKNLVLPNTRLTIAEGAIRPWSRTTSQTSWYQKTLDHLSQKYAFSLDTPINKLSEKNIQILLYGEESSNDEEIFEGVIPNLERRYQETSSEYLRQEIEKYMIEKVCDECQGRRLRKEVLSVTLNAKNIIDVTEMTIENAFSFLTALSTVLTPTQKEIAETLISEINSRLKYLLEVGLGYLTLNRTTATLAGGEAQRIRLANQLGSGLTGVVYILDEPSIGLHPRDHEKLLTTIKELRNRDNTIIVVEHDRETMLNADYIIDMGPGAGERGGEIIATGIPEEIIANPKSITGKFLNRSAKINPSKHRRSSEAKSLTIKNARGNNLKGVTLDIPLNKFICVTGVSGSGKSTLIEDTLAKALEKHFKHTQAEPAQHDEILGTEHIDNIINIDQTAIGRTPRSNPVTYTGVFGPIRELFASTDESLQRGYDPSRFSFNLRGGRCESCRGDGQKKVEMHFLPDIYVSCTECRGKRFNQETLEIKYKDKDISDILAMTVDEALDFFDTEAEVRDKLRILEAVGLGYIRLGQSATTLSGGEAQRIKLSTELSKRETGKTLYILDEPTTGLHFEDIQRLLNILNQLVDRGNTVIVIEHNLDVISCADWIIDLGPDGGDRGGEIIATGTPEEVANSKDSITGSFLRQIPK